MKPPFFATHPLWLPTSMSDGTDAAPLRATEDLIDISLSEPTIRWFYMCLRVLFRVAHCQFPRPPRLKKQSNHLSSTEDGQNSLNPSGCNLQGTHRQKPRPLYYSMVQYPRRHVSCSQCPNIVCERCFGSSRLPEASWMEAKRMHDRGRYVCPLCDGSCLCRRCTRYTTAEDEEDETLTDAQGDEDNHTIATILGQLRESPAKRTSPRHRSKTSKVKKDDLRHLHLDRSLEDAATRIRTRAASGSLLSGNKNRSTKVPKVSKVSAEISLDEDLVCSQESSLDAHACGSDSDETDDGVEVYKVASNPLLELKLEYQDLTERVEKSLKRIEEGRKCMTAFVDYHRDIVSRMRTVRGLIEQKSASV
ncbi:hypothetical protein PROFUN_07794 [Planoprotostelium fungivorum]|uniref:Zinc-finger domain-containing protein n=1 Tax=Planoprotostelium fungivorum TaxID=1890364 RepID=A0A2P6MX17_9EUKA|nr:hypothetical protein PROFUN_07794 [Planoprotostelium fungivorum]